MYIFFSSKIERLLVVLKLSKFLDYLFSKEVFQKFSRDRSITLRFPFLFFSSFSF